MKPKFQVGQVVKYMFDGSFVKVKSRPDAGGNLYILYHKDTWAHESELRALTKRERGTGA